MNFDELDISDEIKSAIDDMGFERLTPIQESAIPVALKGNDLIGQAQTGSGKTIAFAIPILEKVFIQQENYVCRWHLKSQRQAPRLKN